MKLLDAIVGATVQHQTVQHQTVRHQPLQDHAAQHGAPVADGEWPMRFGRVLACPGREHSWIVFDAEHAGTEHALGSIEEALNRFEARHGDGDYAYTFTSLRSALSYFDEYAYVARVFSL